MKYLKSYKTFESHFKSEFLEDIKDITLELSDDDFEVLVHEVNYAPAYKLGSIKAIAIDLKKNEIFKWQDIKEVIERIEDYCWRKDEGYEIVIERMTGVFSDGEFITLDKFILLYESEVIGPEVSFIIYPSKYSVDLNESFQKDTAYLHEYNIYDWFEELKAQQWNKKNTNSKQLKFWSDHFIGKGYFDKVSDLVDSFYKSLTNVDYDYINDRLYDVWDEIPESKDRYVMSCIAYGDYENFDKDIQNRYNGLISYQDLNNQSRKLDIIIHILIDIIYPTLFIGSPSVSMRNSKDEYFVTDEKWQCQNFDIKNYKFKEGDELENGNSGRRSTTYILPSDLKKKESYSVDKVIQMYKPCIVIKIGGHNNSHMSGQFKLDDIESKFDEVLPTILPELDYEDVIWDYLRNQRLKDMNQDGVYDYTVKIILK